MKGFFDVMIGRNRSRYALGLVVVAMTACSASGTSFTQPQPLSLATVSERRDAHAARPKELVISEYNGSGSPSSYISIYKEKYSLKGTITNSLDRPYSLWYDHQGNLYAANYGAADVTEYSKNSDTPSFTYSSGLTCPSGVTTDTKLNVYVTDSCNGNVTEYNQGTSSISVQCTISYVSAKNVAVDASGDVFVSYQATSGHGGIAEYVGGLGNGCNATFYQPINGSQGPPVQPAGLAIDKKGILILCDVMGARVDVIPPPYSSISKYISGFSSPERIALDKKQSLLFVTDSGLNETMVLKYPSGKLKTTIPAAGPGSLWGVAAYPN
jgi:hypothetical protein